MAAALAHPVASDPLNPCVGGLQSFPPLHAATAHARWTSRRRPWPKPLLEAVDLLLSDATAQPTRLPAAELDVEPAAAHPTRSPPLGRRQVLFHLRDAFRAGGVWLARSRPLRRYQKGAAVSPRPR